jgi:hypothetical protein
MTGSSGNHTDTKMRVYDNVGLLYNYVAGMFAEQNVLQAFRPEKIKPVNNAGYAFVVPASLGNSTKPIAVVVHPDKISVSSRVEAASSAVYSWLDNLIPKARAYADDVRTGIEYIPSPPHPLQHSR